MALLQSLSLDCLGGKWHWTLCCVSGIFPDKKGHQMQHTDIISVGECVLFKHTRSQSARRLAGSSAGGNEASCVSSLIWELNYFPCGTAISSFRLSSHLVGWVERRERKSSHPALKTCCHCQSTEPHTDFRLAAVQTQKVEKMYAIWIRGNH